MTEPASQQEVLARLTRIEDALQRIAGIAATKEWYTTSEAAEILRKSEFTVREWCRLGRINAKKRFCGRGDSKEWIISHEEIQRYRNEGLFPNPSRYRYVR